MTTVWQVFEIWDCSMLFPVGLVIKTKRCHLSALLFDCNLSIYVTANAGLRCSVTEMQNSLSINHKQLFNFCCAYLVVFFGSTRVLNMSKVTSRPFINVCMQNRCVSASCYHLFCCFLLILYFYSIAMNIWTCCMVT